MRPSVRQAFVAFTAPIEGVLSFMYLDVRGLVTTAIGNLIDPVTYALTLPWRRSNNEPATQDEIREEWAAVKARQDLKLHGGRAFEGLTNLRLDAQGIDEVVFSKLDMNDGILRGRFTKLETWPADAQLALHSMAWACGPWFNWPLLQRALERQDFQIAALECTIDEHHNPGVHPRNVANRVLFRNAARVKERGLDPDVLYWPKDLTCDPNADTLPSTVHPAVPLDPPDD